MYFIFLIYLLFGIVNGGMIADGFKGRFTWNIEGSALLLSMNIVAIVIAFALAKSSKLKEDGTYKHGLSPGGWGISLTIAYMVGFVAGIFIA